MELKLYKIKVRLEHANCRGEVITGQYVVPSDVTMERKEIAADIKGRLQTVFDECSEFQNTRIKVESIRQMDMAFCYVAEEP